MSRNEDAERDCDATLKVDTKNIKAWFRRGQARAGQEKYEGAKEGALLAINTPVLFSPFSRL